VTLSIYLKLQRQKPPSVGIVHRLVNAYELHLHLYGALGDPRRANNTRGLSGVAELVVHILVAIHSLEVSPVYVSAVKTLLAPVVQARRFIAVIMSPEARFGTHGFVRRRLAMVWGSGLSPSIQRLAGHRIEDIGAVLKVPSLFSVVIRTTGVPPVEGFG